MKDDLPKTYKESLRLVWEAEYLSRAFRASQTLRARAAQENGDGV